MKTFLKLINFLFVILLMLLSLTCKDDDANPSVPTNGSIQGKITNAADGTAISNASIQTNPATNAVNTNQTGDFTINDVTPGTYTVTASKSGFITNSVSVSVVSGKSSTADIQLNISLSAPTLSTPSNGAISQSTSPTLTWNSISGASSYTLQISADSLFTSFVYNQSSLISTSQQVSGLSNNATYYWRVSATNNLGTSGWSIFWSFKTKPIPPTLSLPLNNATDITIPPTLSWNSNNGTASYVLQVSTDISFSNFIYNQSGLTNVNQQIIGLDTNKTYHWRVNTTNSFGTSDWSDIWKFTTGYGISCPGIPTITYEGKTYNTVQIGTQCWLKENLDIGTMIQGSQNQTNNSVIEKYCYNNDPINCNNYGGLYQWNEAMQYSTTSGVQGICPSGWHIPTEAEFYTLQTTVGNDGNTLKAIGQGSHSGSGTNISGFSGLLAGYRHNSGVFASLSNNALFWTSYEIVITGAGSIALTRIDNFLGLVNWPKDEGLSVRCIKD